jgi:hypothetical protein
LFATKSPRSLNIASSEHFSVSASANRLFASPTGCVFGASHRARKVQDVERPTTGIYDLKFPVPSAEAVDLAKGEG